MPSTFAFPTRRRPAERAPRPGRGRGVDRGSVPRPGRVVTVVAGLLAAAAMAGCAAEDPEPDASATVVETAPPLDVAPQAPPSDPEDAAEPGPVVPAQVGVLATGLQAPWGLAFLSDGTALVGERDSGRVLAVSLDGDAREVGLVPGVQSSGEGGLLGLAVTGRTGRETVFAYLSTDSDNRVVRLPYDGNTLGSPQPVLAGIPRALIHNGGGLRIGPDERLYVSTGDAGEPTLAQDRASLAGKILRIRQDGGVPADNPFEGSPVYSLGHRNVQGLDFDADGRLWASEFGASTFDEINEIVAGGNYGWPRFEGRSDGSDPAVIEPVQVWPTSEASPSGLTHLRDTLFVAALRGERLWQLPQRGADGALGTAQPFLTGEVGRIRNVQAAPDGSLWVLTNNTDGRGAPRSGDDKLLSIQVERAN
jgi:glucose/arabinose dehydrogenase